MARSLRSKMVSLGWVVAMLGCTVAEAAAPSAGAMADIPRLQVVANGSRQLNVDGKPFLILSGELHNSTASNATYAAPLWDKLRAMHLNTVIGTLSWAECEPEEGRFDFGPLDSQIQAARAHGLKLVLIWFGAFKNAASTYAPTWVRADTHRFPRAIVRETRKELFTYAGAMKKPVLSVFSPALLDADRRAFTSLMRHLSEVDRDHVVHLVQVENETGLLGDSRDRSPRAESAWKSRVPSSLMQYLARQKAALRPELLAAWSRRGYRMEGTWAQVFGEDWRAEEIFMAWHFARYVGALAEAGKEVLGLPLYANAWLGPQPGQQQAGDYPSGGPVAAMLDIWKAAAPKIDFIGPDVYVRDVKAALADYARPDNPLFSPETEFRTGSLFWALGHHRALGYSVFGVEDGRRDSQLASAYRVLGSMVGVITRAQAEDRIEGLLLEDGDEAVSIRLGGYDILARGARAAMGRMLLDAGVSVPPASGPLPGETEGGAAPGDQRPFGMIIQESSDSFLLVGQDLLVDFTHGRDRLEVDSVEEGEFAAGVWVRGRVLNGDERLMPLPPDRIGVVRIRLLRLPPSPR
ncbi:MAG: hypothetical protein RLZZ200_2844 [Pseudomonadota bacterium]|jgi:hypothetical protein